MKQVLSFSSCNKILIILLIILFTAVTNSSVAVDCEYRLKRIIKKIQKLPTQGLSASLLKEEFLKEIIEIASTQNPPISRDINYILVLSGRGSYLKNPIDHPDVIDKDDDYNRMRLGISVARKVAALRLGKSVNSITMEDFRNHGPTVIYNGRPKHNEDFKKAIKNGLITDYPNDKFIILDLPQDQLNSKGHFISVQKHTDLSNQTIAIVTNAFHFPRIGRMIANEAPFNYFGNDVKIIAYLNDREFKAPGIEKDLVGEAERIPIYIEKGDLKVSINPAIIYKGEKNIAVCND
jgi:hypothetical protein